MRAESTYQLPSSLAAPIYGVISRRKWRLLAQILVPANAVTTQEAAPASAARLADELRIGLPDEHAKVPHVRRDHRYPAAFSAGDEARLCEVMREVRIAIHQHFYPLIFCGIPLRGRSSCPHIAYEGADGSRDHADSEHGCDGPDR